MRTGRSRRSGIATAATWGFLAGAISAAGVIWGVSNTTRLPTPQGQHLENRPLVREPKDLRPDPLANRSHVTAPLLRSSAIPSSIGADSLHELRDRHLQLPVQGAVTRQLRDSFNQPRGSTHRHEAIDILAPRNTPILAVEDGAIARLFESKAGGTTVYQFDPTNTYVYYYAHLERYADGLREGHRVQRGQVLGYVGTSGNAPKDTPHLHFAIFRLTDEKQWWHGSPIDPYSVWK